jgi:hypothetical protein
MRGFLCSSCFVEGPIISFASGMQAEFMTRNQQMEADFPMDARQDLASAPENVRQHTKETANNNLHCCVCS